MGNGQNAQNGKVHKMRGFSFIEGRTRVFKTTLPCESPRHLTKPINHKTADSGSERGERV